MTECQCQAAPVGIQPAEASTVSLCKTCLTAVPARIVERDGPIWLDKRCPEHGGQEELLE